MTPHLKRGSPVWETALGPQVTGTSPAELCGAVFGRQSSHQRYTGSQGPEFRNRQDGCAMGVSWEISGSLEWRSFYIG